MRRHPSETFIRYLLVSGDRRGRDNTWVRASLDAYGLHPAGEEDIASIRATTEPPPVPFLLTDPTHEPSMKYLDKYGMRKLQFQDADVARCNAILGFPPLRHQIEVALLGRVAYPEIVSRLQGRFEVKLTEQAVRYYESFFYNVALLSFDEWSDVLAAHDAEHRYDCEAALSGGEGMALHRLGFKTIVESKTVMQTVQQELYFRFKDIARRPTTGDTVRMLNSTARTLVVVDARLKESDLALKEVIDQFRKFQMEHPDERVADVRQLSEQGGYSGQEDDQRSEQKGG